MKADDGLPLNKESTNACKEDALVVNVLLNRWYNGFKIKSKIFVFIIMSFKINIIKRDGKTLVIHKYTASITDVFSI